EAWTYVGPVVGEHRVEPELECSELWIQTCKVELAVLGDQLLTTEETLEGFPDEFCQRVLSEDTNLALCIGNAYTEHLVVVRVVERVVLVDAALDVDDELVGNDIELLDRL